MTSARATAVAVLSACRRDGAWSNERLKAELSKSRLSRQDAALCTRIIYGVIQNRMLIDFYIATFCNSRKLEPKVRDILRTGICQLVFMSKIPDSAAVNEAVNLTKKLANPRAAGLVNATLRAVVRNKETLPEPVCNSREEYLSVKYSHPLWLVREFYKLLGDRDAERLLQADNSAPLITVQVNTVKSDVTRALSLLEKDGVKAKPRAGLPGCLELEGTGNIADLSAFREGLIRIQDAAAAVSVLAAAPKAGEIVIDGCAAPGGKSFAAAALMKNSGEIYAFDLHEHKIELIEKGAARLGIDIIRAERRDALDPKQSLFGKADLVIADVPCSGLGTIRKKPDVRFKEQEDIKSLPDIQLKILNSLSKYVKNGGRILYSTCTLLPRENQEVVAAFLKENSNFELEKFDTPFGGAESGMLTLWPHIHNTDGFFIALIYKRG